ncbi:hypothetical protein [Georgenia wangjunii]|uniref:hypothetical protein n=1 Tax=Georgenia wangjunii TaxID=3117730 RepID=UPI002F25F5EC
MADGLDDSEGARVTKPGAGSLQFAAKVRIGLALGGLLMLAVMSIGHLGKGLDGAGQVSLVTAGSIMVILAAVGAVPVRGKFKDYDYDFGELDAATDEAQAVADRKPDEQPGMAQPPSAQPVIPADDITIPLFVDAARRSQLMAISPKSALLSVYGEMEEQLRGLAEDVAEAPPAAGRTPFIPVRKLARDLHRSNWVSSWHVDMIEQLTRVRNQAAHTPSDLGPALVRVGNLVEIAAELANDLAQRRVAARSGFRPQ